MKQTSVMAFFDPKGMGRLCAGLNGFHAPIGRDKRPFASEYLAPCAQG
jgi:hypothetical protein